MRKLVLLVVVACALAVALAAEAAEPIKIVVLTGGHGFNAKAFFPLFEGYDDITHVPAPQKDHSELFEDISDWPYDVVVFYNMTQKISEKRRANLLALLDRGVGIVALHHCMAAYSEWPEFKNIIGCKYYLREVTEDGVKHPASGYKHGVDFTIHVEDKTHPVTQGVEDFAIHDETYCRTWVDPKAHILLTTDTPTSDKAVGWAKTWRKARVCTLQMGHGNSIFANPGYRKLVAQAIRWTAGRLGPK